MAGLGLKIPQPHMPVKHLAALVLHINALNMIMAKGSLMLKIAKPTLPYKLPLIPMLSVGPVKRLAINAPILVKLITTPLVLSVNPIIQVTLVPIPPKTVLLVGRHMTLPPARPDMIPNIKA